MTRGYQIHSKEFLRSRIKNFALMVKRWVEDPENEGRELGWFNDDTGDYVRSTRRVIIRWRSQKTKKQKFASIVSSVQPQDLVKLMRPPFSIPKNDDDLLISYSKLYDLRAGAIEIDFKEDKQGLGIVRRAKKKFEAQQIIMLLNSLAHNMIIWMRDLIMAKYPDFRFYGLKRFRRDILNIAGEVWINKHGVVKSIVLNKDAPEAARVACALRKHVRPTKLIISDGNFS